MLDFIMAALPFAAVGIAVALAAVHFSKREKNENKRQADYSLEGMCLGMSFGVLLGSGSGLDLGLCLSLGMLFGLLIGMCMKKKKNDPGQGKERRRGGSDGENPK